MPERTRAFGAIMGAFVADAASAGLHWIYDVEEVRRLAAQSPEFRSLEKNPYHNRRRSGQLTHYGDHLCVALESLVERGGLDVEHYRMRYRERFGAADYDGYLDHATKRLLDTGVGADDDQAGCFTKLPALVACYLHDPELEARLDEGIRATHDNADAVRYGVAAALGIRAAILGASPEDAVAAAAVGGAEELARAALAAGPDHVAFALQAGQQCPVRNAFPTALHAARVATGFKETVRQSILAGGDSAGRLFVAAAIRGAADGVPLDWLGRLETRPEMEQLAWTLLDQAGLN